MYFVLNNNEEQLSECLQIIKDKNRLKINMVINICASCIVTILKARPIFYHYTVHFINKYSSNCQCVTKLFLQIYNSRLFLTLGR